MGKRNLGVEARQHSVIAYLITAKLNFSKLNPEIDTYRYLFIVRRNQKRRRLLQASPFLG